MFLNVALQNIHGHLQELELRNVPFPEEGNGNASKSSPTLANPILAYPDIFQPALFNIF